MTGRREADDRPTRPASAERFVLRWIVAVSLSFTTLPVAAQPAAGVEAASEAGPERRIESLEAQVRELRAMLAGDAEKSSRVIDVPKEPTYPSMKLNGLLHIDGGIVAQDAPNTEQLGDIENSLGLRRARIGVDGFITEQLFYRLVPDFAAPGRPSFRDAYVELIDVPILGAIRLGEFRQPFGMESQTSGGADLIFLERSVAFALSPFRQIGLGIRNQNQDETLTWHASVFGNPSGQWATAVGDSQFGVAARTTAILWEDDASGMLFHAGADYAYLRSGDEGLRYRTGPEYNGLLTGSSGSTSVAPAFVDTGNLPGAWSNAFALELAGICNRMMFQGEVVAAVVDLADGETSVFHGGYVQAAYLLTDDRHSYDRVFGDIQRVSPRRPVNSGGVGAWEVGARLSSLDLDDGAVQGGRIHDVTLGLNWYLNKNTRLQFNAVRAFLDREPVGKSEATIYASRLAVDF